MTPVAHLDAIDNVVAWVTVALCPLVVAGLVMSWVSQHRRPAATSPFTGPSPDPADQLSSPSRSADTRPADTRPPDTRSTDRR